jgi:Mce-associated membrane protein
MTLRQKLTALLAVLVLAAGALTAYLATRPEPADVRPEVAADGAYRVGTLPSEPGEGAVRSAVRAVPKALSYDFRTLDEGLVDATELMTDDFRAEFSEVFAATARPTALEKKAVTRTLVRGGALVRLEDDDTKAVCLVYVDQVLVDSATMKNKAQPVTVSQNRVLVGLEREDGGWLVSSIEPF